MTNNQLEAIEDLITLKKAARITGVRPNTVLKRIQQQGIPFYRIGRVILITRAEAVMSSYRLGKLTKGA